MGRLLAASEKKDALLCIIVRKMLPHRVCASSPSPTTAERWHKAGGDLAAKLQLRDPSNAPEAAGRSQLHGWVQKQTTSLIKHLDCVSAPRPFRNAVHSIGLLPPPPTPPLEAEGGLFFGILN